MRTPDQVPKQSWDEDDSRGFLALGNFAVPGREEQTAAICDLIPPCGGGSHLVELCCGEGALARALLERFPAAQVHGYDGSATMLDHARAALAGHGARFTTQQFDLADRSWRGFPWPVTAVVSSLAIHHLDGEGKRRLFADLCAGLAPGGALLIADLVRPASAAGVALAARAWDEAVRRRALEIAGGLEPYERFRRDGWNFYDDPEPDPLDRPSTLLEQLRWLEEAGFVEVDVCWMLAGHAVFGGRKAS
jgi:tRNA (cmo5U34)-methyltransferase